MDSWTSRKKIRSDLSCGQCQVWDLEKKELLIFGKSYIWCCPHGNLSNYVWFINLSLNSIRSRGAKSAIRFGGKNAVILKIFFQISKMQISKTFGTIYSLLHYSVSQALSHHSGASFWLVFSSFSEVWPRSGQKVQ